MRALDRKLWREFRPGPWRALPKSVSRKTRDRDVREMRCNAPSLQAFRLSRMLQVEGETL
jgi:hypothetical protein